MKTIACVLKTGVWKNRHMDIEYSARQVQWLQRQVAQHYERDHRFVCLTDVLTIPGVRTIQLMHDYPGWWAKMELFREDLGFDDIFYLDLDTVIIGDIAPIIDYRHSFSVLRNLSRGIGIGSGIMAWQASAGHHLYETFRRNPERYMAEYVTSKRWGDQGFIQEHQAGAGGWDHLQDQFPGMIVGHKFEMKGAGEPPEGCRIVVFQGEPKPWQIKEDWIPPL